MRLFHKCVLNFRHYIRHYIQEYHSWFYIMLEMSLVTFLYHVGIEERFDRALWYLDISSQRKRNYKIPKTEVKLYAQRKKKLLYCSESFKFLRWNEMYHKPELFFLVCLAWCHKLLKPNSYLEQFPYKWECQLIHIWSKLTR